MRRPSPTGYCLTPTTDLSKTERGPISMSGPTIIQYVTKPGDSRGKINPFLPTRCRPTVKHSPAAGDAQRLWLQARLRSTPVAPGAPAGWPYGAMPDLCLLSLISRNSPKQLGMVSPEPWCPRNRNGIDVNPFPGVGSLGSDLDGLVTQGDQYTTPNSFSAQDWHIESPCIHSGGLVFPHLSHEE